jgi:histone-lysine N-methyltransferase SETMAR
LQKTKIIFHQDTAPAHKSVLAMGKLRDLHYELLEHPPCSPDLAPSDFCLFPKLNFFLTGQRLSSYQEAIAAVEGYFADLTKNHYRDGIWRWGIAGINVLVIREIMKKKKNYFDIINLFFHC